MESWKPVLNENGAVMINGKNLVLQNIHSMEIGYIEDNETNRLMFSLPILDSRICELNEQYVSEEPETNHKKWNHNLTKSLIYQRLDREKDFSRPKCKKIKLWSNIAKEINDNFKCQLTAEDCDNKYRNLLKTYKCNKRKQKASGESSILWEYFDEFDAVLGCKAAVQPPENTLFDTAEVNRNQDHENTVQGSNDEGVNLNSAGGSSNTNNKKELLHKNGKLNFNEYLYMKNKREEEKQKKKELFEKEKWEEEKQLRINETNAILQLAEALKKN